MNTQHETTTDAIAERAGIIAMKAAGEYFAVHKVTVTDYTRAAALVKKYMKQALPQALADAGEAMRAGMSDVAAQTFAASFRLAGIKAAKEYAGHE